MWRPEIKQLSYKINQATLTDGMGSNITMLCCALFCYGYNGIARHTTHCFMTTITPYTMANDSYFWFDYDDMMNILTIIIRQMGRLKT